jgi:uncharacterized membrane protein
LNLTEAGVKQQKINRREWQDPRNWSDNILGIYFSRKDSRVWVPKRVPILGWTLNLAHRNAMWWIVGLAMIPALGRVLGKLVGDRPRRRSADHW